jgi:hypothetical protein
MLYKENWNTIKEHFKAFFAGEDIGRPLLQVTSPKKNLSRKPVWNWWTIAHNLGNPERALESYEYYCQSTFFGAEALPNLAINLGAGSLAGYLDCIPKIAEDTIWFEERKLDSYQEILNIKIDPENYWWKKTLELTRLATEFGRDKFIIGMTDLNAVLNILAFLHGNERLLTDLIEHPDEVKQAAIHLTDIWFYCYDELSKIINQHLEGMTTWMDVWFPGRGSDVQCDLSAMISPNMFAEFVLPHLQEQCRRLNYSIYHWDGPGQIPHLEHLLDIPELNGIQWVPGAGQPGTGSPRWFPLYQRIQERGKLLVLPVMDKSDVLNVVKNLSSKGLLIQTQCDSEEEARKLISKVEHHFY